MEDKEFICLGCKWATKKGESWAYCGKIGYACNGTQMRPTHFCEDYEAKDDVSK